MMVERLQTFGEITLSKQVLQALSEMGFEEPSPIQKEALPLALNGVDLIGQAQTGTGKTAAFGIPITEKVNPKFQAVQALVLTPTRELAVQVSEEIAKICKYRHIKPLPIYGGQSIDRQIRALRYGCQVVVGTPGRLLDHLNRGTLRLPYVKTVVLDEADEMLDMGFIEDIESILKEVSAEDRQLMLFSATMPLEIRRLAQRYMREPHTITVSRDELTVPLIDQVFYETREKIKVDALCRIIDTEDIGQGIIFCRTKRGVDELVAALEARGYFAEALHGDLSQQQRDRVMKRFRDGKTELLVATDVAARGLDIDKVTHVINFDIPQDPEGYVHRIGRTGRAGRKGQAITLISPKEYRQLRLIEQLIKTRIRRQELPSLSDISERQAENLKNQLIKLIQKNHLGAYRSIAGALLEEYDSMEVAAAALKYAVEGPDAEQREEDDEISFGNTGAAAGMVRLFMNIGRVQQIRPQDIVRWIAEESGVPGNIIGMINIYDKFTFVEVPEEYAQRVLGCMHQNMIKGRKVNVEPAKAR
ncbi:Superfamilies 1 and 2 helicase C-terminal domain protein [Acididesulfobacillus acetoxydans]|uniref:ATP-dependent RNA helicase CshA n=1 Tax=Acididesulfobacillus acetoxydans TaxID=1561005 RepID=A0A8S0Y3W4_9FIRM|nr:DEAD/DEAH box helicase [Acididesulfobacillus acetoxydans]CAA7602495.1 Superfamilies 1 and 2 helicase C-terminal domain protein [Acididesulfobacillus acetoxydans]CEJ05950.1 DEAD-box ATP-dependent RNA helicase CshA [Acididesulfobacillus acetoxydans]